MDLTLGDVSDIVQGASAHYWYKLLHPALVILGMVFHSARDAVVSETHRMSYQRMGFCRVVGML